MRHELEGLLATSTDHGPPRQETGVQLLSHFVLQNKSAGSNRLIRPPEGEKNERVGKSQRFEKTLGAGRESIERRGRRQDLRALGCRKRYVTGASTKN